MFTEQAQRTPDALAATCQSESLSYLELDERSNQLANYLREQGVENEMLVGILGILKAGGAYLPLDSGYPRERLALMLEDGEVSVLLAQKALTTSLPPFEGTLVYLDGDHRISRIGNAIPVQAA